MKKISDKRLLKVIEGLCLVAGERNSSLNAGSIYMITHLTEDCKNEHKDWIQNFLEVEKQLKKEGYI